MMDITKSREESRKQSSTNTRDLKQPFLDECFSYSESDGKLIWKNRPREHFSTDRQWKIWNSNFSGRIAGHESKERHGASYVTIGINYKSYKAHRVVWILHNGPIQCNLEIDHINHDGTDNRIHNLRLVSPSVNMRNRPRQKNNTTGHTGVYWVSSVKRWRAIIQVSGKAKQLGYFESLESAVKARKSAEKEHGFHDGHGNEKILRTAGIRIKGESE